MHVKRATGGIINPVQILILWNKAESGFVFNASFKSGGDSCSVVVEQSHTEVVSFRRNLQRILWK